MSLIFAVAQAREQGCRDRKGLSRDGQEWNAIHFPRGWVNHVLGDGGCFTWSENSGRTISPGDLLVSVRGGTGRRADRTK